MNEETQDIDWIEAYLANNLAPEERTKLEQRLQSDQAFSGLFTIISQIGKGIKHREREKLLKEMEQWEKELDTPTVIQINTTKQKWRRWSVAAGVLVLISLGTYFFLSNNSKVLSPEMTFVQKSLRKNPFPINLIRRSEFSELKNEHQLNYIIQNYQNQNFAKIISPLKEILKNKPNSKAELYLGIAYLGSNNAAAAISPLKSIQNSFPIYKYDALWYLALAYLELGDTNNLKQTLSELELSEDYRPKVQEIRSFLGNSKFK